MPEQTLTPSNPDALGKVGIIAGGGQLPRLLVSACQSSGIEVFVLALEGFAEQETVANVEHAWVRLGAVSEAFKALKTAGVVNVVFAGGVKRPSLAHLKPDLRATAFLARLGAKAIGDDGLLRAVGEEFEKEGFYLKGAHEILSDLLAKEGCYGTVYPTPEDEVDIARAFEVAKGVGALDVGQGAVVQQGIVLAVEAVEGTDSMLQRCKDLRREGDGGVLVKVCKPHQDRRLDLPTVGVQTVESIAAAGLSGLAVEAGAALVLEPEAIAQKADELGVFVKGLPASGSEDAPLVYLIAGEPSGDVLAARLIRALRERTDGRVRFAGVGGESMAAEGVTSLFPQSDIAVMGFTEVVPKIPIVLKRVKNVVADIRKTRPAVVVSIDSLGFNKRVAKALQKCNNPTPRVHYVAPMVWAWKPKRAETVAQIFDHLLCLLSFEPPYFEKHGLATTHVGHPVVESGLKDGNGAEFRQRHGIADDETVVCILPGSRQNEVSRMLPIYQEATEILHKTYPNLRIVLPTVATVADYICDSVRAWKHQPIVVRGEQERWHAFAAADGAIATSGTVSLELAQAGVPFVIGYRANPMSAWLAKRLISIRYATLINHVHDGMVIPEYIQENCTPENLAEALSPYLAPSEKRDVYISEIENGLKDVVGPYSQPSLRAADAILEAAGIAVDTSEAGTHIQSDS